ncbi:nucleotidyltransferase domain-containing protein [Priestia megaterium]|uniref:nucleotidyltransferase domain-containing protein n=1 Tax=Priestia megaterium TaxID=1404 RepID=UPI0012B9637E|nr:nucleotidyltransferase family protein [Priestia megaterium]
MNHKFQLDLTLMPKELKVLLELIKDDDNQHIHENTSEWFANMNWDYFLKLAMHHRVYPLVYLKLKVIAGEVIPFHVLQTLQKEYQKNTFRMLHLSGEMERISKLLAEKQIRSLFLKGPVVAYDLYGDISLRTSKDLDILISEVDLPKAESLLLKEGYEKEKVSTILNEIKWRHHHVSYFHPEKKIQIEIHWRLHPRPMKEPKFEELWDRKRTSSLTKHPVPFLGEEDLFLYLIAHGARHGWFRLRWLKDIDQILKKKKMDDMKVRLSIKKYQQQRLVDQACVLVVQLLDYPLNKAFSSKKSAQRITYQAYTYIINAEDFTYSNKYLFSLQPTMQRIYFIMILLYPHSIDTKTLALPKPLYFLYFLLRPTLWLWRRTERWK